MNKTHTVLIAALLVCTTLCSQSVTLRCLTVGTGVCSSGYQWIVSGTNDGITLNNTICSSLNCKVGTSTFDIQACKIDYKNTQCSTGICFVKSQVDVCVNDMTCGNSTNPETYMVNYSCADCGASNTSCTKCFFANTNRAGFNNTVTCLGANCTEGLSNVQSTIKYLGTQLDNLGQNCTCAVKNREQSRYCTTNSGALNQSAVTTWFNKVEGNFESKLSIMIALCLTTLFAFMF